MQTSLKIIRHVFQRFLIWTTGWPEIDFTYIGEPSIYKEQGVRFFDRKVLVSSYDYLCYKSYSSGQNHSPEKIPFHCHKKSELFIITRTIPTI
jgi:hypothetical protein